MRKPPPRPHHPVVVAEHAPGGRPTSQLRIADAITAFAGSMPFVYIHAVAVRRLDARSSKQTRGRS